MLPEFRYAAGLLEGEGYFTAHKGTIKVGCRMTDPDPLFFLQSIVGGTVYGPYARVKGRAPIYTWYLGKREPVVRFLRRVLPFMSLRRAAQIQVLLQRAEQFPRRLSWQHGSVTGYQHHKCRCRKCRLAYSTYRKAYYAAS
jgi:hypothetical protein